MVDDRDENKIIEVQGEGLTPLDSFWLDIMRGTAKESVGALEEAAKQLIAVTTLAQAIYFAAVSFGDVKAALGTLPPADSGQSPPRSSFRWSSGSPASRSLGACLSRRSIGRAWTRPTMRERLTRRLSLTNTCNWGARTAC